MVPQVVFIQNSVHLAGAQKSLSRLLTAPAMREHDPVLLTGQSGWLTERCETHRVKCIRLPFPASRSLMARVWSTHAFAKKAARALQTVLEPGRPVIVHTNDHPDSLIGLALAQKLNGIPVLTLRTPGMSQRDFEKYRCGAHTHVIAVGDQLFNKVRPWVAGQRAMTLVHNGVTEEEILPAADSATQGLEKLLVLGSVIPRKGWQDLIAALLLLESRLPPGQLPEVHFLGDLLGKDPVAILGTERLKRFRVTFLGVVEGYRDCLRQYRLAVHPSRSESFGMAALECVAAGVPLLAASTGLIPDFIPREGFLFPPQDVDCLAAQLEPLLKQPLSETCAAFAFDEAQAIIKDRFSTPGTVRKLKKIYKGLMPELS